MFPGNDFCYMTESYLFFPGERGLELATGTSEATVGDVFYCFSSTLILTLILIIFSDGRKHVWTPQEMTLSMLSMSMM